MKIVIDTNILVNAFVGSEPDHTWVVYGGLLTASPTNQLCIDIENVIKKEYENNVGKTTGYKKWYLRLREEKKLHFTKGKLDQKHRDYLSRHGCHEHADHVFVGVAHNNDKILISEDSDFGKGPKGNIPPHNDALKYLQEIMRIKVLDAKEAKDTIEKLFGALNALQNINQPIPTNPRKRLRVFFCYTLSDRPAVGSFHDALTNTKIDAWIDTKNILPGANWQAEISQAIHNSDVVIIFLSIQSITKEGYVQKEIRLALEAADEKPDGTIFIIPARLENCKIPDKLAKFQWVDLFENLGYEQLLKALRSRADNLGISVE